MRVLTKFFTYGADKTFANDGFIPTNDVNKTEQKLETHNIGLKFHESLKSLIHTLI